MNELKQEIKSRLLEKLDHSMEMEDEAVQELVENEVWLMGKETYIPLAEKKRLCREIYYAIRKYDVLQELLEDETVTEIMVNGPDHIFIEKEGRLQQWQTAFESEDKLLDVIQQIVAKANRVVNESSPIVDARLFGSRVHVVLPPVALNGPILTIRRFGKTPLLIPELLRLGSVSQEICTFLEKLVIAGYNIFISGGTGSGKTTFLNALSSFIPRTERIITIEDSAELQIQGNDNLVRLETRNANVEGCKPVTIRDLIRASLRMRPDRILIGEIRGAEAIDLLQALNTGHDGSLSTGHANTPQDMLSRIETMALMDFDMPLSAIRRQIASGIDLIVHLGRLRDKTRKVLQILEILGYDPQSGEIRTQVLYEFVEEGVDACGKVCGRLVARKGLRRREKLERAGLTL